MDTPEKRRAFVDSIASHPILQLFDSLDIRPVLDAYLVSEDAGDEALKAFANSPLVNALLDRQRALRLSVVNHVDAPQAFVEPNLDYLGREYRAPSRGLWELD